MKAASVNASRWPRLWAVVLALNPFGALAAVQLGLVNARGRAGADLDVPVVLGGAEAVTSLQFDVRFDVNRITPGAAKPGAAASGHRIDSRAVGPGLIRVVIYSTTLAPLGAGPIVQLPVKWNTAGDSGVRIETVQAVSPEGTKVECVVTESKAPSSSLPAWAWGLLALPIVLLAAWWWRRRRPS